MRHVSTAGSLTIIKDFFESFRQPTNRAERMLIRGITEAALGIARLPADPELVDRVEAELASDSQPRYFHSYLSNDRGFASGFVLGRKATLLHEGVIAMMRPGAAPLSQKSGSSRTGPMPGRKFSGRCPGSSKGWLPTWRRRS